MNKFIFDKQTQEIFEKDSTKYTDWIKHHLVLNLTENEIILQALSDFQDEVPQTGTSEILPIAQLWFYLSEFANISNELHSELVDFMIFCEDEHVSPAHPLTRDAFILEIKAIISNS